MKLSARAQVGKWLRNLGEHYTIRASAEHCNLKPQKLALLDYVVLPLIPPSRFRDRTRFSNRGMAQEMLRGLNELGYAVDVISSRNTHWRPIRHYDLFVGHGAMNTAEIASCLGYETPFVYFSTGTYWKEWNRSEAKRFYELAERRGHILPPDRAIRCSEETANQAADGIICLGRAAQSYQEFETVYSVPMATFPASAAQLPGRDYARSRSEFLFFSGWGNVHKGLDLLLETFARVPSAQLHVCQQIESDFFAVYARELSLPNVHVHGFVPARSPKFFKLAARCAWVISATCAEGQPGAVLDCMSQGLVPILPDEANIEVCPEGLRIAPCTVEVLGQTLHQALTMDPTELETRSAVTAHRVRTMHTPELFRRHFKSAVSQIVDDFHAVQAA